MPTAPRVERLSLGDGASAVSACDGIGRTVMNEAAIADHGMIGDLQTAALLSTDGSVDWFCCPASTHRASSARCSTTSGAATSGCGPPRAVPARQMYFPDTAVLITRFFTEAGVGEVVDFMPLAGEAATDTHRLVRMVRCVRGG